MEPEKSLRELISPDIESVFWTPPLLGQESAWWAHVPFAFWIMTACRPRVFVELGTHNGISYAAFCEANLRKHIGARCYAIDTWAGDHQAGLYGGKVYDALRAFHDQHFSAFSELVRSTFEDALSRFPDGSIDLLHIDGLHTYEAVRHDFESWHPKLSSRGVVLFHDTNVLRDDFGVYRLFAELASQRLSFEFMHGYGLGLIAVGEEVPEGVKALCDLSDPSDVLALRARFAQLGAHWHLYMRATLDEARSHGREAEAQGKLAEQSAAMAQMEKTQAEAQGKLAEQSAAMAQMEKTQARNLHQLAELRVDLEKTRRQEDQRKAELQNMLGNAQQREAELQNMLGNAQQREAELQNELADAQRAAFGPEGAPRHRLKDSRERLRRSVLKRLGESGRRKAAALEQAEIIASSMYFDPKWYLSHYPDVAQSGVNPALHYTLFGAAEGREPGPNFCAQQYLLSNPDVAEFGNPLLHYALYGAAERRRFVRNKFAKPTPDFPDWFDADYYLSQLPSGITEDAYTHFIKTGWREGYNPHPLFDVSWFLEQNPALQNGSVETLIKVLTQTKLGGTRGPAATKMLSPGFSLKPYSPPGRVSFQEFDEARFFTALLGADVLSLDIFDTALVRRVSTPVAVFDLMEAQATDFDPQLTGLARMRIEAERIARDISMETKGTPEVGLQDIHDVLARELGLDAGERSRIFDLELSTERQVLCANPRLLNWAQDARAHGKKVIFVSDMYLPRTFLQNVLAAVGFEDPIVYVSNECGCGKWETKLYHLIASDLGVPPARFLHVGDNFQADKKAAEEAGWTAFHLVEGETQQPFALQIEGVSTLDPANPATSVTLGLSRVHRLHVVDAHLPKDEEMARNIGYEILGPTALAFAHWVATKAKAQRMDRVLFLARDSYLPHHAYERLREWGLEACESRYVAASRRLLYGRLFTDTESITTFTKKLHINPDTTLAEYLDIFRLPETQVHDCAHRLSIGDIHKPIMQQFNGRYGYAEIIHLLTATVSQCASQIIDANLAHNEILDRYYREVGDLAGAKRVAIVDLGWSGSLVPALHKCIMTTSLNNGVLATYFFGLISHYRNFLISSDINDAYFFKDHDFTLHNNLRLPNTPVEILGASPSLLEILLSENVPSAVDLRVNSDGPDSFIPVRCYDNYTQEQRHFMDTAHSAALHFIDDFLSLAPRQPICWHFQPMLFRLWARLLSSPSEDEARVLGNFPHRVDASGQAATTTLLTHSRDIALIEAFHSSLWPAGWFALLSPPERATLVQQITQGEV